VHNRFKRISVSSVIIILFSILTGLTFQANEKQQKIVIVKSDNLDQYNEAFNGFVAALEEAGIQFQTKIFTLKTGDQLIVDSLTTIGSQKPDAILTIGTTATREVSKKITTLPVFFTMVLNPEKNGIANSDTNAITNLSGVRLDIPIETQLKLVKQVFSNLKAIGILYHPLQDSQIFRQCMDEAQKLNIKIAPGEIQTEEDIPTALKNIRAKSNVLLLISNQYILNYSSLKYILMYGLSNNFPVIGLSEFHVKAGALLAIRADYEDAGRQAGNLIIDLLSNSLPESVHLYRPPKTKLFINKRTADMMGIAIPVMFLSQAEQVYE
jgi:putative ABC transport system substrate-binding protein